MKAYDNDNTWILYKHHSVLFYFEHTCGLESLILTLMSKNCKLLMRVLATFNWL